MASGASPRMPDLNGLPQPSGPFTVGRRVFHWVDAGREERSGTDRGRPRELMVWIWYPADPAEGSVRAEHLPGAWAETGRVWGFQAAGSRSHAYQDAPPISGSESFPVVIFSPAGFPPLLLSALLEEIASHGYVVAGINHTYQSAITPFPDGRVIPMDMATIQALLGPFSGDPNVTIRGRSELAQLQNEDIGFAVHQLTELQRGGDALSGLMSLDRLAVFGHSLGGNAALEYCGTDPRCRGAVNLDGGIWSGVGQVGAPRPTLLIMADHPELIMPCDALVAGGAYPSQAWCEVEQSLVVGGWETLFQKSEPGYAVAIKGSGHISFMDIPFMPIDQGSVIAAALGRVTIGSERAWRITSDYLLAFFGWCLKGASVALLNGASPYPEARSGSPSALLHS